MAVSVLAAAEPSREPDRAADEERLRSTLCGLATVLAQTLADRPARAVRVRLPMDVLGGGVEIVATIAGTGPGAPVEYRVTGSGMAALGYGGG